MFNYKSQKIFSEYKDFVRTGDGNSFHSNLIDGYEKYIEEKERKNNRHINRLRELGV